MTSIVPLRHINGLRALDKIVWRKLKLEQIDRRETLLLKTLRNIFRVINKEV